MGRGFVFFDKVKAEGDKVKAEGGRYTSHEGTSKGGEERDQW